MLLLLGILLAFGSCKKDDGLDPTIVPPRALSEVAVEDDAEIKAYLETHFYNYEEFNNPPADFDYKIVLDTIAGSNADKISLMDDPKLETMSVSVSSEDFGLEDNETVSHTLYFLSARDGMGGMPTAADSTLLRFEGSLLNNQVFDGIASFDWQYLPFFVRGYAQAISNFRGGDGITVNPDGTTAIENSGIGVMFLPSGLGFYSSSVPGVPAFSPLIFKIETGLFVEDTDFDNDGIPSRLEDLNGDGDVTNDNTDAEQEQSIGSPAFANHVDSDDDQDGTPTRDEISDSEGNIIIPYPDTDGDGIPDYLDRDNS